MSLDSVLNAKATLAWNFVGHARFPRSTCEISLVFYSIRLETRARTTYRASARYVRFSCCFFDRPTPTEPLLLREPVVERELLRKSQHRREKVKRIEYSPSGYQSAPFSDPSCAPPCHIASVSASKMQITSFFRAEKPIFFPPLETEREKEREEVANFQLYSPINLGTKRPSQDEGSNLSYTIVRFSCFDTANHHIGGKEIVKRFVRCCNWVTLDCKFTGEKYYVGDFSFRGKGNFENSFLSSWIKWF